MYKIVLILALFLASFFAKAEPQTNKLRLPAMDCPMYTLTIKKALNKATQWRV